MVFEGIFMVRKFVSFFVDGVLSGIIVSIGCTVFIQCDSKALGALLFSFGLFVIITFHLGLYTGKTGYLPDNGKKYIIEVLLTLVSNFIGAMTGAFFLRLTRLGENLDLKAEEILDIKFNDSNISVFFLSVFCGIMMYIAVEANKRCILEKNHVIGSLSVIMPVMIFVYGSFNHSVADFAYFSISGFHNWGRAIGYFPLVVIGNGVGGMFLPLAKRLSMDK